MKIIILLFTFGVIINFTHLQSQTYQPIPDSNAAWIIQQSDGFGGYRFHRFFLSPDKNDTLINSTNYTKIYLRYDVADPDYYGAFRNGSNGKSYYVPAFDTTEYLLRDFTKNTGDTIKNVAYQIITDWTWVLDFVVDSTGSITSGPYTYKIMYLSTVVEDTLWNDMPDEPLVWVEKIGSFGFGIVNSKMGDLGAHRLYCMEYNDTIYLDPPVWWFFPEFIVYNPGPCDDPVVVKEMHTEQLHIYPNPFTNQIRLRNLQAGIDLNICLFDQLGRQIWCKNIKNALTNEEIAIPAQIIPGIYMIKIFSDKNLLLTKKLIKQ